jgi:hypothetical protein
MAMNVLRKGIMSVASLPPWHHVFERKVHSKQHISAYFPCPIHGYMVLAFLEKHKTQDVFVGLGLEVRTINLASEKFLHEMAVTRSVLKWRVKSELSKQL